MTIFVFDFSVWASIRLVKLRPKKLKSYHARMHFRSIFLVKNSISKMSGFSFSSPSTTAAATGFSFGQPQQQQATGFSTGFGASMTFSIRYFFQVFSKFDGLFQLPQLRQPPLVHPA
jgi:hypothetical protein